jgi:hypothetical protein
MLSHATTAWLRAHARLWRAGAWSCCAHTHGEYTAACQPARQAQPTAPVAAASSTARQHARRSQQRLWQQLPAQHGSTPGAASSACGSSRQPSK